MEVHDFDKNIKQVHELMIKLLDAVSSISPVTEDVILCKDIKIPLFDYSSVTREQKLIIARKLFTVQLCSDALQNILEFYAVNLFNK